jgi:hypothetical protein
MSKQNFQINDQVRHEDGTLGRIVAINNGLIEWKSLSTWRLSHPFKLVKVEHKIFRWRKDKT